MAGSCCSLRHASALLSFLACSSTTCASSTTTNSTHVRLCRTCWLMKWQTRSTCKRGSKNQAGKIRPEGAQKMT